MNIRTMLKSFAVLTATTMLALGAQAKNYSTVWSQDFEDGETYTENMSGGSVTNTLFGTPTSSSGDLPGTPTQASRALVNPSGTSHFYSIKSTWKSGNLLFTIPDAVTNTIVASQDYIVEFDYYLNFITTGTYSGLAIQGANGPIATFYATAGSKSGESTGGKLYLGDTADTVLIDTVKGYSREADPSSSNCNKYWMHVTIKGVNTESDPTKNGLFMTVVRNNQSSPATLLAETRVGDFDVVTHLYQRFSTNTGTSYKKYVSLDDVSVATAVAANTFTWTGDAGDGKWATPGNWKVGTEVQTKYYPTESDTAEVTIENQTIYVTPGQKFGTLTAVDSTTLAVLFTEDDQQFTAPTGFGGTVVAAGPFSVTSEAGVYTATRQDATFAWANTEGGDWIEAANWTVNGLATAVLPNAKDEVIFNNAVTVTTTGTALCSNLVVNAQVTVADTGDQMLSIGDADNNLGATVSISGTGSLVLSGARVRSGFTVVNLDVPLEIAANTTNVILIGVKKNVGGYGFYVNKAVTGSGKIEVTQTTGENNAGTGVRFIGDMSGFTGSVEFYQGRSLRGGVYSYQSRALDLIYPSANGENAAWNIYADHWGDIEVGRDSGNYFAEDDATYKFGALKLRLPTAKNDRGYCTNVTLEVGHLDLDSYAKYSWKSAKNCGINWVAPTATFVNEAANTTFLNVSGGGVMVIPFTAGLPTDSLSFTDKGGTLKVGYDLVVDSYDTSITNAVPVDPSAVIMNSTAAIVFDDQGTNCTWTTTIDASNVGGLTKQGAGTLTINKGTELKGALQIEEGKLWFTGDIADTFETLVSWDVVAGAKEVTTDDFDVKGSVSLQIVTNDTRVLLQGRRAGQEYTYVGGDFGLWSEVANWQVSGVAAEVVPSPLDNVTISDGNRVVVVPEQTFGTVTLEGDAKLAVKFTEGGQTISLPTGLSESDVVACGPFTMALSEGVFTATRVPSTFVWTGAASDGVWETLGNWTVNGTPTYIAMDRTDTALFTTEATVALGDNTSLTNLTIQANVTIDGGANTHCIQQLNEVVSENGAILTLNNARLQSRDIWDDPATWTADIAIVGDCQFRAYTGNTGSSLSKLYYNGKLSGSGNLTCTECHYKHTSRAGVVLGGDNSAFSGTITMTAGNTGASGNSSRTPGFIGAAQALSSNAVWNIDGNNSDQDQLTDIRNFKGTSDNYTKLYFGALNGTWNIKVTNPGKSEENPYYSMYEEFVIGGANVDCTFSPIFSRAGTGVDRKDSFLAIRKVGTAELTIEGEDDGTSVYRETIESGVLKLDGPNSVAEQLIFEGGNLKISYYEASSNVITVVSEDPYVTETNVVKYTACVDPSASIVNSTGAISFDTDGTNHTWATALAKSNVGGLTKKGAGTLTLEKAPLITNGFVRVEAGTLVVPDGTELNVDASATTNITGGVLTYAYPEAYTMTLTTNGWDVVAFDNGTLDASNLKIDASEMVLKNKEQPYSIATAMDIKNVTQDNLILPEGVDSGWRLAVQNVDGKPTLVLMKVFGLGVFIF